MKSPTFRFFKQILSSTAAVALLGLVVIASPARADVNYLLCPNAAWTGSDGTGVFTNVSGPLDATCGSLSAVTMSLRQEGGSAGIAWIGSLPGFSPTLGYPVDLTFGTLAGVTADVTGSQGMQPYYMLGLTDPATDFLGATAGDQILMIENQSQTLSGDTLALDPNTTLFDLFDNDTNVYLAGGQSDTHTLAGWLAIYPSLADVSLQFVEIGIGSAVPSDLGPLASDTVNSLDITAVPEPTALLLLLVLLGTVGLGIRLGQPRRS